MTETELIACVADRAGISRTAVQDFLKVLGEETRRALVQRGSVPVFGLGKLKVVSYQHLTLPTTNSV